MELFVQENNTIEKMKEPTLRCSVLKAKYRRSAYMLDKVARLPGGTLFTCPRHPARRGSFLPCERFVPAILANRGEINRENMAARGEFIRSYHLPVLSPEQNDSQS